MPHNLAGLGVERVHVPFSFAATGDVVFSLLAYIAVYAVIYSFGLLLHLSVVARRADRSGGRARRFHACPRARSGNADGAG